MPDPLVSVIIPAYNAERFLTRSLRSVLDQTYPRLQVIVVDDGSTDYTAHIVNRHADLRMTYVRQANQGPGAARNTGVKIARGEYVTFLDADDYYLPTKIAEQVAFLDGRDDTIAYCDALHYESNWPEHFYRRRGPRPSGNLLPWLMGEPLINPNTVMYPRKVFEVVGLFDPTYNFPEEWDWYIRCCQAGFMFAYQERDLVVVEVRRDSMIKWSNQPALRARTIAMLVRLLPDPFEVDGRTYDPAIARRRLARKLQLARLAVSPWGWPLRTFWRWNRLRSVDYMPTAR